MYSKLFFAFLVTFGCTTPREKDTVNNDLSSSQDQQVATSKSANAKREQLPTKVRDGTQEELTSRAMTYMKNGDYIAAQKAAWMILNKNFRNTSAQFILAKVAVAQKRWNRAILILARLGGKRSKNADVMYLLGRSYLGRNELHLGSQFLRQAIQYKPDHKEAYFHLGLIHLNARHFKQSSQYFDRAHSLNPNDFQAKLHLAISLAAAGNHSRAEQIYASIEDAGRYTGIVDFNYAVLKARRGQYLAAIAELKEYKENRAGNLATRKRVNQIIEELRIMQAARQGITQDQVNDIADGAGEQEESEDGDFIMTGIGAIEKQD